VKFLQRVLLQSLHPVGSRGISDQIWLEAASQDQANGFLDLKKFVNPDGPLVPGVVTQVPAGGPCGLVRHRC
jgi:hypothetical protein